jgi:hypothetical protein
MEQPAPRIFLAQYLHRLIFHSAYKLIALFHPKSYDASQKRPNDVSSGDGAEAAVAMPTPFHSSILGDVHNLPPMDCQPSASQSDRAFVLNFVT